MLKHIPQNLSPELLKILMEMGHGDELVISDGNFPAASHAARLTRLDGQLIPAVLESILTLMPLDTYVDEPVIYMATPKEEPRPVIWKEYGNILIETGNRFAEIAEIDRFAFYARAKKAYAIVTTSETALYANIILKKGVIQP